MPPFFVFPPSLRLCIATNSYTKDTEHTSEKLKRLTANPSALSSRHMQPSPGCVLLLVPEEPQDARLRAFCACIQQRCSQHVIVSTAKEQQQQRQREAAAFIFLMHDEMTALAEEGRWQCTHDFWLCLEDATTESTLHRFEQLLQRLAHTTQQQQMQQPEPAGEWSHFVCLTWSDLRGQERAIRDACAGCDAVELRVDLLADQSAISLQRQMALLREALPDHVQIIYTVRSDDEGGKYPAQDTQGYTELLLEGLRAAVDWVDVEASKAKASDVVGKIPWAAYPCTRVLSSKHDLPASAPSQCVLDESYVISALEECATACPQASMLKVVTVATSWDSALRLSAAANAVQKQWRRQPFICLAMGEAGSMTRVFNRLWTPVTHPSLPVKAAPGQLSLVQIMRLRRELNILTPKHFYLFGSDIQRSPSPAMHNAVFSLCHLPFQYSGLQTDSVAAIVEAITAPDFGGASVTMPFKEAILEHLDDISGPAAVIGAVNTVAVAATESGKRRLIGHNTDWIGIFRPIKSLLDQQHRMRHDRAMLVLGAGGTARAAAYAGQQLGLRLVVYNRTLEKGQQIANDFGGRVIADLNEVRSDGLAVIISTIPPSAQADLPEHLFQYKPIAFDVVYHPPVTPLIAQAQRLGCPFVLGKEMLLEQAKQQQQIWLGKTPPHDEMKAALEQFAAQVASQR